MTYKICHITSAHDSLDDRIFEKECISLSKMNNFDVNIVAPGKSFEKKGINIVGVGNSSDNRMLRILFVSKKVVEVAKNMKCDLYHIHDPELLRYALKLKRTGAIVIFDSHENYSEQIKEKHYLPLLARNFISKIYKKFESYVCKRIDAVIFPCLIDGKHPFENRAKNVILIDNFPSIEAVYNRYNKNIKKNNDNVVCYTGGISRERGITNLIKGCYLAKARLILAGQFSPPNYQDELKQLKEYDCVDYRGICSRDEVISILEEADIGANVLMNIGQYPHLCNLSTKVYEFMSFELPVIINDYDYGKKLIEKYRFGLTANPSDYTDIAQKIQFLMSNIEIAEQMGKNGRYLVKNKFNWSIEAKKLIGLYNKLLNERFM